MGIIVQKFGGSSVADTEKLFNVCEHVLKAYNEGNGVVVVVSAQGKTTDKLIAEEAEISNKPTKREHDVLVATGEQITIAKLAMCLNKLGHKAVSYMGWQVPIITDGVFGEARIKKIDTAKIMKDLDEGTIVVVAGFQGVSEKGDITTFGRGGSDTTAVALAAALKADKCEIFTDVDGVFSADPRIVEDAIKIETMTYDEMLELSSSGAKVLHNRCVEIAKNFEMPIVVKSSFEKESTGTLVDRYDKMEGLHIGGIAVMNDVSKVTLLGMADRIGETYKIFKILSENDINIDIIAQSRGEHAPKDVSFSIGTEDLEKTIDLLDNNTEGLEYTEIKYFTNLSKISLVGVGIANTPGVAASMFEALSECNINMRLISTSEIKISVLIDENKAERAMKAIHEKLTLGKHLV
ncbi:MAG: aspartate kinase [Oscillospiraceae bacterium]|nr:aspartate kinase [Oscillospiraceae bacterium]